MNRRLHQFLTLGGTRFRRLLAMTFFNGASMVGELLLFGLAVYELSGSTAWVGFSLALYFGPNLFVGAIAGTIADSFDRVRVLRVVEAALGVNLFVIGALFLSGGAGLAVVLVLTLVSGVFRAAYNPARSSYAFDLAGAERIVSALGTLNIALRLGQLMGALVAGWAAAEIGIGVAYLALSAAHVLALASFGRQRAGASTPRAERSSMRTGLVEFFRELGPLLILFMVIANRPLLILFMVTGAVEVFGFSFLTALPDLAVGRLGLGAAGLGVLHASRSIGGIIGGIVMAMAGPSRRLGVVWLAMIAAFGLEVMALGLAPILPVAVMVTAAIAFCAVASDVLTQSMMQLAVPGALRGRAMGAWQVAVGFSPIGRSTWRWGSSPARSEPPGRCCSTARRWCWSRSAPVQRGGSGRCECARAAYNDGAATSLRRPTAASHPPRRVTPRPVALPDPEGAEGRAHWAF